MPRILFLLAWVLLASNAVAYFTGAGFSGEQLEDVVRTDGAVVASLSAVAKSLGREPRQFGESCRVLVLENGHAVAKEIMDAKNETLVDLMKLFSVLKESEHDWDKANAEVLKGCPVSVDEVQEFFHATVEDLGHRLRLCREGGRPCYSIPKTPPMDAFEDAPNDNVLMAAPYLFADAQIRCSFLYRGYEQRQKDDRCMSPKALQSWFTNVHDGLGPSLKKVAAALSYMRDVEVVGTLVGRPQVDVWLWHWTGKGVSEYIFFRYTCSFFEAGRSSRMLSAEVDEGCLEMASGTNGLQDGLDSALIDNATLALVFEGLAGNCSALAEVFLCFEIPDGVLLVSELNFPKYAQRLEISRSVLGPRLLSAAKDWARARENALLDDPRARNFRLVERNGLRNGFRNEYIKLTRNDAPKDAATWRHWMTLEQGANISLATAWISKPDELLLGRITVDEFTSLFYYSSISQNEVQVSGDRHTATAERVGPLTVSCTMVGGSMVLSLSEEEGVFDCIRQGWGENAVETVLA